MDIPPADTPIVCDLSTATDTPEERFAEYRRLFGRSLTGRERTADGIRFRFRADEGVEDRVRDLAAREKACCAFMGFDIAVRDGEVVCDVGVADDDTARAILDEFYALPDTPAATMADLDARFAGKGLTIVADGSRYRMTER